MGSSRVEHTTDSTLAYNELTNTVHPIFEHTQWTNLATGGWTVVEQSCKLASLFLQSAVLRPFWATLICQEYLDRASDQRKQFSLAAFDSITPVQQARVDRVLNEDLPKHLKFTIDKKTKIGAHCQANDIPLCCGWHTHQDGNNSDIFIAESTYLKLRDAQHQTVIDIAELMLLRFRLAVDLIHEVSHAVRKVTDAVEDEEPFFGDAIISEIGYELEKYLFGGPVQCLWDQEETKQEGTDPKDTDREKTDTIVPDMRLIRHNGVKSNVKGVLVLFEWPYQGIVSEYGQANRQIGRRKNPRDVRKLDLGWRVNITFIARFFHDAFWQGLNHQDVTVFHPPRTCGYTFRVTTGSALLPVCRAYREAPYLGTTHARDADGVIVPTSSTSVPRPGPSRRLSRGRVTKPTAGKSRRSRRKT